MIFKEENRNDEVQRAILVGFNHNNKKVIFIWMNPWKS